MVKTVVGTAVGQQAKEGDTFADAWSQLIYHGPRPNETWEGLAWPNGK